MPDKPDEQPAAGSVDGPGVLLRRARETKGLTLRDVAQDLHLDEWMLQALEEDDYSALGAPVFAKGHMRKYGSLLGLDTDDLMIAYYRKRGRDDSPPPITHMQSPQQPQREFSLPALRWLIAALGMLLLILLAWRFFSLEQPGQAGAVTQPQPVPTVPAEVSPPVIAPSAAEIAPDVVDEPDTQLLLQPDKLATDGPAQPEAAPAEAEPEAAPVVAPVEVRLSFSGESWVEVTDSEGNRLLYDMMSEGSVRTVRGTAPIEVFLGRSRVVRIDVDGEFFPIPRRAIRGNTARFVIDPAAS